MTGAQAGIVTDGVHTKARIQNITPQRVHQLLGDGKVVIVAGFQGQTIDGQVTTRPAVEGQLLDIAGRTPAQPSAYGAFRM